MINSSPRYSRQTILPEWGEVGQQCVAHSCVIVVGAGGLGSPVIQYLAAAGVGEIHIFDPDIVSLSNLQRQVLYTEANIGQSKALLAAARARQMNSEIIVMDHQQSFDTDVSSELIERTDLIVDCTDNYAARIAIDRVAELARIPWIYAAIDGFEGQISVFGGASATYFRNLYSEEEVLIAQPTLPPGVAPATPGAIGAMQASEALKILSGIGSSLDGRLFIINLINYQTYIFEL